ncbi:MAG: hypothetical protein HY765_10075 [Rhodomicrobium sp.]|nr:hypothetical protein [Rhodomicrobium sp.]
MRKTGIAFLVPVMLGFSPCIWAGKGFLSAAQAAPKAPKGAASVVEGERIPMEGEEPKTPIDDGGGNAEAQSRPVPPTSGPPAPVTLTAYLSEGAAPMTADIVWRIFEGRPGAHGKYHLLETVREPRPTLVLKPGEYLINIAYGRANLTKKVGVWPENPTKEDFVINAGGLRINPTLAHGPIAAEHLLKFELFSDTQDQFGNRQKLYGDLRPGVVMRLNSGIYHVVSTYGDANSVIATDVVIEPGKITEAGVDHDAGRITFKLVQRSGGEAAADTRWTIYNSAGEVIKESAGAFPTHILAAGDYRVAAQHGDRQYAGAFSVAAGDTKLVEVLMQ